MAITHQYRKTCLRCKKKFLSNHVKSVCDKCEKKTIERKANGGRMKKKKKNEMKVCNDCEKNYNPLKSRSSLYCGKCHKKREEYLHKPTIMPPNRTGNNAHTPKELLKPKTAVIPITKESINIAWKEKRKAELIYKGKASVLGVLESKYFDRATLKQEVISELLTEMTDDELEAIGIKKIKKVK